MPASRLLGADFMRAAACLIVLAHHLGQRLSWSHPAGFMDWFRVFAQVGAMGVAMFFVLSGFLLARPFWQALDAGEPLPSLRTYALRRAARILPGFWLALWVTFALSITVFGTPLDAALVVRVLAGTFLVADWHWLTLFPVEINGPLWSIGMEVTSYLLLPLGLLALFFVGSGGWRARLGWVAVIGVTLLAHWAFVAWFPIDEVRRGWDFGLVGGAKYWMPRFNPFGFFAMFAIGGLAAGLQVRMARLQHVAFDLVALVALYAAAYWLFVVQGQLPTGDSWGWLGIPYQFPWFALSIGAFLAAAPQSRVVGALLDNPPVRYLARISFGIYVWHYVVLELVRITIAPDIGQGGMEDPVRFVLLSALITAVTMLIAHLSFSYLETPVMQWARRLERRPAAKPVPAPAE
jgi:peptidoglycan/LPS O-acetylase OafA/YrhL